MTTIHPSGADLRGNAYVTCDGRRVHVMRLGATWTWRGHEDGPLFRHREHAIASALDWVRR